MLVRFNVPLSKPDAEASNRRRSDNKRPELMGSEYTGVRA